MGEQKRKFENPTQGWVGAVILDDDNKPKGMPVEPGGSIWLSKAEERLTAEAPRMADDNPFTKPWREVTEFSENGEPRAWNDHVGVLRLSDEPAREIVSDRYTPSQDLVAQADVEPERQGDQEQQPAEQEITGAPPLPQQPPVQGKPAPDEHVATPEAVQANDEYLAAKAAEDEDSSSEEERSSEIVAAEGPKGQEAIGVKKEPALV
jgi:hypothetical protein